MDNTVLPKKASGYLCATVGEDADNISKEIDDNLRRYSRYLKVAIDNARDNNFTIPVHRIHNSTFTFVTHQKLFRITPKTIINVDMSDGCWRKVLSKDELEDEGECIQKGDEIEIGKGRGRKVITLDDSNFMNDGSSDYLRIPDYEDGLSVKWYGYDLELGPSSEQISEDTNITCEGKPLTIESINEDGSIVLIGDAVNKHLRVNGVRKNYSVIRSFDKRLLNGYDVHTENDDFLVVSDNSLTFSDADCSIHDCTSEELATMDPHQIHIDGMTSSELGLTRSKNAWITEVKLSASSEVLYDGHPGWELKLKFNKSSDLIYRLDENTGEGDSESFTEDNRVRLFENNLQVYDGSCTKKNEIGYRIKDRDNFEVEFYKPNLPNQAYELESDCVTVKMDVAMLINEKNSIDNLRFSSHPDNIPLVNLFRVRENVNWPSFSIMSEPPNDWKVLKDDGYDGVNEQREFVLKSLSTPDFAVLDGPPGTGKTTAILELILQLILMGKRVLLASSTNAAINNLLERLTKVAKNDQSISDVLYAVRLGDSQKAIGVEEQSLNVLVNQYKAECDTTLDDVKISNLIIQSSNVVCGTIAAVHNNLCRHQNPDKTEDIIPPLNVPPQFDYLIVDESSKTTLQEFLVPAMIAKRFVLVGDIRQLSPFTDESEVTSNLRSFTSEFVNDYQKKALALLSQVRYLTNRPKPKNMIILVDVPVLSVIKEELSYRDKSLYPHISVIDAETDFSNVIITYQNGCIFIDPDTYLSNWQVLPKDCYVYNLPSWSELPQAAMFNLFSDVRDIKELDRIRELSKREAEDSFRNTWEKEVEWRLNRLYWLRNINKQFKKQKLDKDLVFLTPYSDWDAEKTPVMSSIKRVRNMAYPSILEKLTEETHRTYENSAIAFNEDERKNRSTTLEYQHRMDPEISMQPRKLFYNSKSLLDGKLDAREYWNYDRYPSSNVWIDCDGKDEKRVNDAEAEIIYKEICLFLDWAKSQDHDYQIAVLTFYKAQKKAIAGYLQKLDGCSGKTDRFVVGNVSIKVATVDFIQGQEADMVFLSMVRVRHKIGFMDTPNRLNVAVTRARCQMVYVGRHAFYSEEQSDSSQLRELAKNARVM